jgi:hypothetical protein
VPGPLRTNPLLKGRVSDDGTRILWHGLDGKRFDTVKKHLAGEEVEITIGRLRKKRSGKQNRYYRGIVVEMIAEAAGYSTNEEAHDALRIHFLRKHHDERPATIRSTTELTTSEFEEYLSKCRQLAAEMWGIYIPLPNEVPAE